MRVTPEIHRRALKLFTETWPRNEEETRKLLDRCGDDTVLRHEVESLLKAEADSGDFIAEPLLRLPQVSSDELAPGDLVGPYKIERLLGRGGMGTVYLVTKDDPGFEVRSALKIVRPDRSRDGVMQRFQQEQEILAKLDHPNIVKPKDRGVTPEGAPYLVMDLVEGEPIDQYCARVGIEERIEVFRKVCAAVHYAHKNLIVHRDLKPANILVTAKGEPKILDFGIAQLEDSSPYSTHAETLRQTTSVFLGTLRYASPEQVHNEGQLTTGSDVYSLGVLLYELLAGRHPFEEACNSFVDLGRAICEEAPAKPSTVARLQEITPSASPEVTTSPETEKQPRELIDPLELRRKIAGDLDSIVLKAMSRDPKDRYNSSKEFSDDLERSQEDLPVEARSFTRRYRLAKYLSKHSRTVAVLGLMLPVVLGSCFRTQLALDREQDALEREQEARVEAEQAFMVADYFVKAFQIENPTENIAARDLLDQHRWEIERAMRWEDEKGEVRAELQSQTLQDVTDLLETYGWAYFGVGEPEKATEWLSMALERRRKRPDDVDLVLNLVRLSAARDEAGQTALAERDREEALERIGSEKFDDLGLAQWLNDTARLLEHRGAYEAAEELHRAVLAMKRRLLGDRELGVAVSHSNLGSVLGSLGKYEDAVAHHRDAFELVTEISEGAEGERTVDLLTYQNSLATALRDLAWSRQDPEDPSWAESEALYQENLRARERAGHRQIAAVLNNWALLKLYRGQLTGNGDLLEKSQADFGRALDLVEGESLSAAIVRRNRATLFQALGDPIQAEAEARRALDLFDEHDETHWRALDAKSVLGSCLLDLGHLDEAEPLILQSVAQLEATPTPALPSTQVLQRLELLNSVKRRLADG